MQKNIILLFFLTLAGSLPGQENKQFTLDELIPGGKNFYNYFPRISQQFQWHGDQLIIIRGDSIFTADPAKPGRQEYCFGFNDIHPGAGETQDRVTKVAFDREGSDNLTFHTDCGIGSFNLKAKRVTTYLTYPKGSLNHRPAPGNIRLAYTRENNLYLSDADGRETALSDEENLGIVYGEAAHRNEFGIDSGIFWSPAGDKLAFYRIDQTMVSDYPLVDVSSRVAEIKDIKYPMAGMRSHEVSIGVYDIQSGRTVYLQTGEPKDKYLTNIAWSPDGSSIYLAELNREQNQLMLNRYDATTGQLALTLMEESHPKYVEPQHPVLFVKNDPGRLILQSARDGYNHLYLYDLSGKPPRQLTQGEWEVTDVLGFDDKGQNLYFLSTHPSPLDRHAYSVNLKTGKMTRHTTLPGIHNVSVSRSGRYLVDRHVAHDNPGLTDLLDTRNGKATPLAAARDPFAPFLMPSVETGTIKAADGQTDLYYRMVKPADFDEQKSYPVVVYVYGGPHSQLVSNRWRYGSGGWETHIAQKGYIVFVMDNRGTSYRGTEFENVTHRRLGIEEAKDQMKGVEFLQSLPYVDDNRLGIHGWSYGGFMTINLLLRYPGVFKAGVAGGPVIDWKFYEVMYGERYMDTPQENPQGYEESSLLNKADKLEARLLIIHGDEDPVVVMQHSLRFLKAAIGAGTHPDFFVYPGHEHNMIGPDRVHLHEHITRYFDDFCK